MSGAIVLFHSNGCGYCKQLLKFWSSETGDKKHNVVSSLKKIDPNLLFYDCEMSDPRKWNSKIPSSMLRMIRHVPMIFYIPGSLWREDPNHQLDFQQVKCYNCRYNEKIGAYESENRYNFDLNGFVSWFNDIVSSRGGIIRNEEPSTSSSLLISVIDDKAEKKKEKEKKKKFKNCSTKTKMSSLRITR